MGDDFMKYNRLTVINVYTKTRPNGKKAKFAWCKCDCGNEKELNLSRVRTGVTKSCGCLSREKTTERNTTHGMRKHPAYDTYNGMMSRCYNKNKQSYRHYGNRGIKVCKQWHDIEVFLKWCDNNGFKKEYQLDRIDNNQGYSPENCRFVTPTINLRNTRRNVIVGGFSLKEYLDNLGEKHNIGFPTLRYRYYTIKKEGLEPSEKLLIHDSRWIKTKR